MTLDIEALEALEKKATPGEWALYESNSWRRVGMAHGYAEVLWPGKARSDGHPDIHGVNRDNDLAMLVAARNALPELLRLARIGQRVERDAKDTKCST